MDQNDKGKIAELNEQETEQVVGGKMARAPVHPAGEFNTVNPNSGVEPRHEHALKK